MKKFYTLGLIGLALFEILNVYFIMPMPGSQRMDSIDLAYFLYSSRWAFRILFAAMILAGMRKAFQVKRKWIPVLVALPELCIVYVFNFHITAERMFLQPVTLTMADRTTTKLNDSTVVIAVEHQGQVKAYPIRYILFHHQVRDSIGDLHMMVTYCSVCRTGRVFSPVVSGRVEHFRLVGMDHFNAMFEDATTMSWWRQENGEAAAGPLKGMVLPEIPSSQLTLGRLFAKHPDALVMKPDPSSENSYDLPGLFERGESKGPLTRTDTLPWKEKSWVVGLHLGDGCKAYDWQTLQRQRIINDRVGKTDIVLVSFGVQDFAAFVRPSGKEFTLRGDTLFSGLSCWDLEGRTLTGAPPESLQPLNAYQEFWHSWKTFHPETKKN